MKNLLAFQSIVSYHTNNKHQLVNYKNVHLKDLYFNNSNIYYPA